MTLCPRCDHPIPVWQTEADHAAICDAGQPVVPHTHDRYCALLGCASVDDHEPGRDWPNVTGGGR